MPESYTAGYQSNADTIPGLPTHLEELEKIEEWFLRLPPSKHWGETYLPMVTSSIDDCASVGRDALLEGGSAVDGAIASQICHGFFNPLSAGVGGGSFMVVYDENRNLDIVYNAREAAPLSVSAAKRARGRTSREGGLAIAVPGEVAGFFMAWKQFGKLPWARLFTRTIYWCERGRNISKEHAESIRANAEFLMTNAVLREDYVINRKLLGEGQTLRRRRLGHTLRRIALDPLSFYKGSLARDILSDAQDEGAPWTEADLSDYRALASEALRFRLPNMGLTLLTAPPPSLGAMAGYALSIIDEFAFHSKSWDPFNFDEDSWTSRLGPKVALNNAATTMHRVIEAMKFGIAARDNIGDPRFNREEITEHLGRLPAMASRDAKWIRYALSTFDYNVYFNKQRGAPWPATTVDAGDLGHVQTLVADLDGLVVSLTSSVGLRFGSRCVGRRTGIVFNSAMADFSTVPSPMFDKRLNEIASQARPASTMVPTILVDDRFRAQAALGATGGSRGISYMIWAILYRFPFRPHKNPEIYLDKFKFRQPLLHPLLSQGLVERRYFYPESVIRALRSKGHRFIEWEPDSGEAQALTMMRLTDVTWLAYPDRVPTNGLMSYSGVS